MLAFSLLLVVSNPVYGVVVYKHGSNKPTVGFLVRESATEIVLREESTGGMLREVAIPKAEAEEIIYSVSPERLAALRPEQPHDYREYAEELAEKRLDPEARAMAIRLYQIAAWLDPKGVGPGALRGLISLARGPDEETHFRAAVFLFDPAHDKALLGATPAVIVSKRDRAGHPAYVLLEATRQVRRGRGQQGRAALAISSVALELDSHADIMTREEFNAACAAKEHSAGQLRKLLHLEITLENSLEGPDQGQPVKATPAADSWREALNSQGLAPIRSLDFLTLTGFDPRACVYRDGNWITP